MEAHCLAGQKKEDLNNDSAWKHYCDSNLGGSVRKSVRFRNQHVQANESFARRVQVREHVQVSEIWHVQLSAWPLQEGKMICVLVN